MKKVNRSKVSVISVPSSDASQQREAKSLLKKCLTAAMKSQPNGLRAYSSPNFLRSQPACKSLLSAPTATQVAFVRLAIPVACKYAKNENDAAAAVLLSVLLRKNLPLEVSDVAELLSGIAKRDGLVYLSDKVLLGFLDRWVTTPVSKDFSKALGAYIRTLSPEYDRQELMQARALRDRCAESGDRAVPEKVEKSPLPQPPVSPLEVALLKRESLKSPTGSTLAQRAVSALTLPAETGEPLSATFAQFPGGDRTAIQAVNEILGNSRGQIGVSWQPQAQRNPGKVIASPASAKCIATSFSAVAALTLNQIKVQFKNPRAERFHNGVELILMLSIAGLKKLKSASPDELVDLCDAISRYTDLEYVYPEWDEIALHVSRLAKPHIKSRSTSLALLRFRERLARTGDAGDRAAVVKFDESLGIGLNFSVDLGERWSDRMYSDTRDMKPTHRFAWEAFLKACALVTGAQPSAKWIAQVKELLKPIPAEQFERSVAAWFSLVGKPRPLMQGGKVEGRDSSVPSERASDVLRGMAFAASLFDNPRVARALGDLAMACYKMVPGVGARCIKPGTAAVWALSQLKNSEALSQLSRVRQLVKFGTAKKTLDLALNKLARQLSLSTDELHEIAAPDFGLEPDGTIRLDAGEYTIELRIEGAAASVRVLDQAGKERANMPESVKRDHKASLAELKQVAADIDKMLPAQKDRIERLFHEDRSWSLEAWRSRYHEHPLVGTLARRLIWTFESGKSNAAIWSGSHWVDRTGTHFKPDPESTVRLWHPIHAKSNEVLEWRANLEDRKIRQPFKQAHREIYVLTDAERRTADYSNRFTAHIIKQAQFNALCQQRGWKHTLFLSEYGEPAVLPIQRLGLSARFVVSGVGEEIYGNAGAYSFLQTDQVAFVDEDGERVPLRTIPPLVFSEVMRDVDLFIGVCSVGLDPAWGDTGGHEFGNRYWRDFAFGDLSETAKTRRDVLSRLIPRLKIASVCELGDKFLKVKGKIREYKIHLGSGNILMEPNDQYLCIVPSSRADSSGSIHLPFDGDRVLSIILSKALMLAEDDKIKDSTINSQIRR